MAGVRPSALPCTRLRDSCVACAVSKLKCPKQRPSCSRCETRGIDCQYFFARRPGRRREHGRGHPTSCTSRSSRSAEPYSQPNAVPDSQGDQSGHGDPAATVRASISPVDLTADLAPTANLPGSHGWATVIPEDGDGTYPADAFSMPTGSTTVPQLDDSAMDLLMADSDQHPVMETDKIAATPEGTIGGTQPVPDATNLDLNLDAPFTSSKIPLSTDPSGKDPHALSNQTSLPSDSTTVNPANITNSTCICVPRALALLRALSCAQSSQTALPETHPALYTLYQHKPNIALARRMLSCPPCTENTFLLAILSLIVLNILERYATALQRQLHDTNHSSRANGSGNGSGNGNGNASCVDPGTVAKLAHCIIACRRVPSRVIVSELCRLQSLVNHLAPRVVGQGAEALERMEGGMREGLGGLSGDIIDRLRRY
ncbi:hypothetical protein BJX68DRAFT_168442 [Aspergillus pseudodeflectus]|uniref:Zn(2)-C6 fungal-type domain-containing protein n=1 Tax=Aspergillus pseudodeflectus TaxID=176178 RepID=A0ABR4JQ19_9EURO